MESYDVVVVGAGHNALAAAAYLTQAGRSVLVLDRNDRAGGFVRTDEIVPGYVGDSFSAVHASFVSGPVWSDLGRELESRGLRYLTADLPSGVSMENGTTAVLPGTLDGLVAEAERLAPGDGAALSSMLTEFGPHAGDLFSLFTLDPTSKEAGAAVDRLLRDGDGPGFSAFAASVFESARDAVGRFTSPTLQSMLGSWPTHFGKGPDDAGGGPWVTLFALTALNGGLPIPEGGSGKLAEALARLVTDQGGVIRTGTPVDRILVHDGRARGVVTGEGDRYGATEAVIASVNPDQLYLHLLDRGDAPAALVGQARRYRYGPGQVQLNLALARPPAWPDERFGRMGQPFLTDSLDGLALHVAQARAGLLPATPTFSVQVPTAVDPSRAPAGGAVMRVQVTDVPARPRGDAAGEIDTGDGRWSADLTDRFADRVLDLLDRHVPGLRHTILGRTVVTPDTLAAYNPNAGPGDPYGGAQDLVQSYFFRPLPGQPGHRTHLPNLYTLGACTWPGGGVSGASGHIVARLLLDTAARASDARRAG